jgi:hypothetical protein
LLQSLVFMLFALVAVAGVVAIGIAFVRGKKETALFFIKGLAALCLVYAAVLVGVSLASKEEEIGLGQEKCFDDWCVTVRGWKKSVIGNSSPDAKQYLMVTIQVTNEARRADFRPDHPRVVLIDDEGGVHRVSIEGTEAYAQANGEQPEIAKHVIAGESFTTTVVFDIPAGSAHAKLFIAEGGWPTQWIISDENSYFHAPRVTRLY